MNDSSATGCQATVKHRITRVTLIALAMLSGLACAVAEGEDRPRARDLGIVVGTFEPGQLNAITDVPGVRVGQATIVRGDNIRTGVTLIFPHTGNPFHSRVP